MIRKENLLLTYASGEALFNAVTFWVYVKSLRNVPNSDCVMLTHDMPDEVRERLTDSGVEVVDFPAENILYVLRDRHLAYWTYLNEHGHKYRYVFASDCKDVMFQKSPFDWAEEWKSRYDNISGPKKFLDHFVILVSEGFKMPRSGFACIENFEFERDVQLPFLKKDRDRWVVNGGTMLGTPKALQDFFFLVWITTMKSIGRITDQGTLNWLLHYLDKDETYSICQPQHDNLCLIGEGVKEGVVEPVLTDGILNNPQGKPYCALHQWERMDGLREDILAQYTE